MFPFQVFILLILLLLLLLAPSFPSPIFLSSFPLLIFFPFQFFFLYLLFLQAPTSSILRRVNSAHCGVYYMYGDVIFLASPSFCHAQKWCLPLASRAHGCVCWPATCQHQNSIFWQTHFNYLFFPSFISFSLFASQPFSHTFDIMFKFNDNFFRKFLYKIHFSHKFFCLSNTNFVQCDTISDISFCVGHEAAVFDFIGRVDNLPIDILLDVTSWCPHPPVRRVESLRNTCKNVWWESLVQSVVCLTECMLRSLLKGLLLTLLSSSCVCPYVYIRYCGVIQLHVVGQDLSPVLRV